MNWIDVNYKLPKEHKYYLVYTIEHKIEILRFDGNVGVVTHWMHLPKSPFISEDYCDCKDCKKENI